MHGEEAGLYAYGMWPVVVFNILLFLFFVVGFVDPKKRFEWRSMGAFVAFIVALFTEMYGFPLTIYLLSGWLGQDYPVLNPFTHAHGHLWLVFLGLADSHMAMSILHLISNAFIFFGIYIIYKGWILIHGAKSNEMVTDGVYAYVRHPQYSGIFLVTIGFLIQWPTLITLMMFPILIFAYYKLAMKEERDVESQFGDQYRTYRKKVPAFIPAWGRRGGQ